MARWIGLLVGCALLVATAAHAESVLVTQTVDTLEAATDKVLTGTGSGIRMLCVQNIGANPATLAFGVAAVAGSGWALAAGASLCWYADIVPRNIVHGISTAGTTLAVLVGR